MHDLEHAAENAAFAVLMADHARQPDAGYFGTDPATSAFGGKDFAANFVSGEPSSFKWSYFMTMHAHSTYWNRGSAALSNMAFIVTGLYEKVAVLSPAPVVRRDGG